LVKVSTIVLVNPVPLPTPVTPFKLRVQLYVVPVVALFRVMFNTPRLQMFCNVGTGVNFGVGFTVTLTVSTFVQLFAVIVITYFTTVGAVVLLVNFSPIVSLFDNALGDGVIEAFATRTQLKDVPNVPVVALYLNVSFEQIALGVLLLDKLGIDKIVAKTVSCSLQLFAVNV
jgi:hypothetical protein